MSDRKRLLPELRVLELRAELEKRNLDKSGVRGVLIQRLAKDLQDEGHDPDTIRIDVISTECKSPVAGTQCSTVERESKEVPVINDMIVRVDLSEEDDQEAEPRVAFAGIEKDIATQTTKDNTMEMESTAKVTLKRNITVDLRAAEAKKPCLDIEEDLINDNDAEAEDSINLSLEEHDEDELLYGETDEAAKIEDEASNEGAAQTACEDSAQAISATDDITTADNQQGNAEVPAPATSNAIENEDEDQKAGVKTELESDNEKKVDSKENGARNLWVSGLSSDTRARDLKQLCNQHGKVIGAKIVTSAKDPGSQRYGYVTMATSQDVEQCIKNLHGTELHRQLILVEKARAEPESRRPRQEDKDEGSKEVETNTEEKNKEDGEEFHRPTSRTSEKPHRSEKEREIARARERLRAAAAREEERRRRAAANALRERERRQRQQKHYLAMEREKLRVEREMIEREKNELLRLERERHRLERERLELERAELKKTQLRLEEERRKRSYAMERNQRPAPPPPPALSSRRAELSSYDKRDRDRDYAYRRDYPRQVSSSVTKCSSNGGSTGGRLPAPTGTGAREPARYDSRDPRPHRPEPPGWSSDRYPAATASKGVGGGHSAQSVGYWGAHLYQSTSYPDRYPAKDYRRY